MTTRDYEALVIVKAAGTEQEIARVAAQLEDPIKKVGGRLEVNQNMGRRRLAFRILRQTEGYYFLLRFHAPTEQIAELERLFRLSDVIVRFIILTADEAGPLRPAAAVPTAVSRYGAAASSRN